MTAIATLAPTSVSSAKGILAFLHDEDVSLKSFALDILNSDMDTLWTEVAGHVEQIEIIYDDETFPDHALVALVLAKVYYHLKAYHQAMVFSLSAGDLFDISAPTEFEETIIAESIDHWVSQADAAYRKNAQNSGEKSTNFSQSEASVTSPTTPFSAQHMPSKSLLSRDTFSLESAQDLEPAQNQALEKRVLQLFHLAIQQKKYRQVLGMIFESKRLDLYPQVILDAQKDHPNDPAFVKDLMEYSLTMCLDVVQEHGFRNNLLKVILKVLNDIEDPDYSAIAKCAVYLDAPEKAASILRQLVETGNDASVVSAYQIAFDLYDNSTQEFLGNVISKLPSPTTEAPAAAAPAQSGENQPLLEEGAPAVDSDATEDDEPTPEKKLSKAFSNIHLILNGTKTVRLNLEFLYSNNKSDMSSLSKVRECLDGRNSIFHSALTFCNAFMNYGTMNDKFFRDNLDWLSKAVNWSKFTATAALGVIHRGNVDQVHKLLDPYLPKNSSHGSIYSQGGALYAYGLAHANNGAVALDYLKQQFTDAVEEVILHGGALGLGIAGMATGSTELLDKLKVVLYSDSALNGEAVGLGMGLIMLGTGNESAIEDMMSYAHETSHEKTVRGLALGMALIMYNRQEGADTLIETLLQDTNPALRYGGILMVAMAYCGTGSNKAVRKLLHTAVSDVSDDVRRVAVMSLGFVLFRKPSSVPRMVELLAESYNPHVRYGAAMALGISCAGTGLAEAIELLEPMVKDPSDFVRQGALIALSMILIQQNDTMNPKAASVRKTLKKVVANRHEDAMTRFGSALSLGILDAGGRNCTIGLQTQTGNLNMSGIVGMAVFTQYWYWFPFAHFLSLSFSPTSVIALDQDLNVPSFKFHCSARPSLFDYMPEQEAKAEEAPALLKMAVLSTTALAKRRAQKKEIAQKKEKTPGPDAMDVDMADAKPAAEAGSATEGEKKKETSEAPVEHKKRDKAGYDMDNMTRVLPGQFKYISFPDSRFRPVKTATGGPLLVIDTKPNEPKTLIRPKLPRLAPPRTSAPQGHNLLGRAPHASRLSGAAGTRGSGGSRRQVNDEIFQGLQEILTATAGRAVPGATTQSQPRVPLADQGDESEEPVQPEDFDYHSDSPEDEEEDDE